MKLFDFAIIIALSSAFTLTGGAEFYFKEKSVKFPDTMEGVVLTHTFSFINKGDQPLIISDYKVACSCTKLIFPQEPIPPGEPGSVQITFDTKGKYGYQNRKILIQSNAVNSPYTLSFKVFVISPEN